MCSVVTIATDVPWQLIEFKAYFSGSSELILPGSMVRVPPFSPVFISIRIQCVTGNLAMRILAAHAPRDAFQVHSQSTRADFALCASVVSLRARECHARNRDPVVSASITGGRNATAAIAQALELLGRASGDSQNRTDAVLGSLHWPVAVNLAQRTLAKELEALETEAVTAIAVYTAGTEHERRH